MSILTVQNLTKIFKPDFWSFKKRPSNLVINNISFDLKKSEILGFLGTNGAGKTTTIQMLLGTLTPSSGSIHYFGQDFFQHRIKAVKKIGYASGYEKLPARLTVTENLDIIARIYGMPYVVRTARIKKMLHSFGLWNFRNQQVGLLSAGQMTRVMLSKAFIADPEIVLLDEPTASLDPDIAHEVRQFILAQRKERGISILITSHNMNEVTELCDRVLVLKQGVIIANDKPEILAATIAKVHLHITISSGLDTLIIYMNDNKLGYSLQEPYITVDLDEHAIAPFLAQLSTLNVIYSHISIDKPTLEDYFLTIAQSKE